VGRAGFLVESEVESSMVCPRENAVLEQANAGFVGVERCSRNHLIFRATVEEKYIP
jgi:hypothetical protein